MNIPPWSLPSSDPERKGEDAEQCRGLEGGVLQILGPSRFKPGDVCKWAGGHSSVVECLPSMCKALGSITSTEIKKYLTKS
jgi:hypothetical protein